MPEVTIIRTHHRGQKCNLREVEPLKGPITYGTLYSTDLNRHVDCMRLKRGHYRDGRERPDAAPPLFEPRILTFDTEVGMMLTGFEQIDGTRYYQGWYIRWADSYVRAYQTSEIVE